MIYFSRSSFLREIYKTSLFTAAKRQKFAKIEKPAFTNSTFFVLKFVPQRMRCAVNILEDFTEENLRI